MIFSRNFFLVYENLLLKFFLFLTIKKRNINNFFNNITIIDKKIFLILIFNF
ncbi:hypothetical protein DDB_G0268416 [Dictyostelium discoideum AX4]|uniref:hypothetical protein n=1 Tax=Dictyostelium discoideum AX4 TaxID=352472 RepID=UPI00004E2ABD|nr:hypothetical protein DDB_G0268416 [Dictyostelium discoideum AX4]EAL73661.1 hypothetical protein DDB_G0268416 [Dictyostelium discoideum AX4]|eukprot:XP_647485.1 hypothetical protein DDB_G0268416 [Dictyostelium discoideum AX4]